MCFAPVCCWKLLKTFESLFNLCIFGQKIGIWFSVYNFSGTMDAKIEKERFPSPQKVTLSSQTNRRRNRKSSGWVRKRDVRTYFGNSGFAHLAWSRSKPRWGSGVDQDLFGLWSLWLETRYNLNFHAKNLSFEFSR